MILPCKCWKNLKAERKKCSNREFIMYTIFFNLIRIILNILRNLSGRLQLTIFMIRKVWRDAWMRVTRSFRSSCRMEGTWSRTSGSPMTRGKLSDVSKRLKLGKVRRFLAIFCYFTQFFIKKNLKKMHKKFQSLLLISAFCLPVARLQPINQFM